MCANNRATVLLPAPDGPSIATTSLEPPGWPAAPGVEAASLGGRVTDWTELENENDPDWERSPPDLPGADDRVSDWPDERGAKSTDRGRPLAMVLQQPRWETNLHAARVATWPRAASTS